MKDRARLVDAAFVVACLAVFAAIVVNVQLGASRTLVQSLLRAG